MKGKRESLGWACLIVTAGVAAFQLWPSDRPRFFGWQMFSFVYEEPFLEVQVVPETPKKIATVYQLASVYRPEIDWERVVADAFCPQIDAPIIARWVYPNGSQKTRELCGDF